MERAEPGPAREAREGLFLPLEDTRLVKRYLPSGESRRLRPLAVGLGAEPEGVRGFPVRTSRLGDAMRSDDKMIGDG